MPWDGTCCPARSQLTGPTAPKRRRPAQARRIFLPWIVLSASASALPAQYQPGSWGTGFRVGASPYDLDGTGTGVILGPQADLALTRVFFGELSVMAFDHSADMSFAGVEASERTRFLLPEV